MSSILKKKTERAYTVYCFFDLPSVSFKKMSHQKSRFNPELNGYFHLVGLKIDIFRN